MINETIANFHTHTTFCDGKNTPEEIIISAIDKGFSAIGLSGHGYTPFDLRYCMKDTDGYINEINRLKIKYADKIQVYLGIEEDAFAPSDRSKFDYIIGSSHYFCVGDKYFPIDSNYDYFKKCLPLFEGDAVKMGNAYFGAFCDYIRKRRPDIIGHFDLITKFDEMDEPIFKNNLEYQKLAEKFLLQTIKYGCIYEINTGAITRGIRSTVYPSENLLYILKKENAKIILASDSHQIETLDGAFTQTKEYLKDIGFKNLCTLLNGEFVSINI